MRPILDRTRARFHGENDLTEAFAYSQSVELLECIFCCQTSSLCSA